MKGKQLRSFYFKAVNSMESARSSSLDLLSSFPFSVQYSSALQFLLVKMANESANLHVPAKISYHHN